MPDASPSPVVGQPPPGKTFRVSMWIISGLGLAQLAAIAFAVVSKDLGNRPLAERRPVGFKLGSNLANSTRTPAGFPPLERVFSQQGRLLQSRPDVEFEPTTQDTVTDPVAREHFTIGKLQRKAGNVLAALENFRLAAQALPGNAEILYQMANCYEALDHPDKASDTWLEIHKLGEARGGEFYKFAELELLGSDNGGAARRSVITIRNTHLYEHPQETTGEMVTLRLSIGAVPGIAIEPTSVHLRVLFFDLISGNTIARAFLADGSSDFPRRMVTEPMDWEETGEELIDVAYYRPYEDGKPGGERRFYGFVAQLFYDDEWQDIVANPRTLSEDMRNLEELPPIPDPDGSRVESSLFPRP